MHSTSRLEHDVLFDERLELPRLEVTALGIMQCALGGSMRPTKAENGRLKLRLPPAQTDISVTAKLMASNRQDVQRANASLVAHQEGGQMPGRARARRLSS